MAASKFYIMNEKAVRWPLNSPEKGVFTEPHGFGIDYSGEYLKVGNFWTPNNRELKQPSPSGKIVFAKNQYTVFQQFINFLNAASQLVLVYQPARTETEYFAEIDVVSIQKGGYNKGNVFVVPVQFACKSLFYTEEKFEYQIQKAEKEVRWDFRWETQFNDQNRVYFNFNNDGHVESPFTLSFTGFCTNPAITVYHDGKLVHQVHFNLSLQANERLTFSSFDDDLLIEVDGVDRKDCLDFTKENFFKLPKGDSEIYFSSSAGRMNNITMTMEKYYKGV